MKFINFLLGAISGLLAAAAIGALWSLFALATGGRAPWMAPVAAVLLLLVLRFNGHRAGPQRALAATLLLAVTIAHANYVMAAGFIAASMGLELVEALRLIGVDMAYAVARAHGNLTDVICYGLSLFACVALGMRQPGESAAAAPTRGRVKRAT